MSNGNVVIVGAARTPIGKYAIIKSFKSYQTLVELYVEWFLSVAVYHSSNLSGTLNGSLSSLKAHELGSAAITGALIRSNVRPEEVSDVIMGQVSFLFVNGQVSNIDFWISLHDINTWPRSSFQWMIVCHRFWWPVKGKTQLVKRQWTRKYHTMSQPLWWAWYVGLD